MNIEFRKLKEIAEVKIGAPTYYFSGSAVGDKGVPVINIGDINDIGIDEKAIRYYEPTKPKNLEKYRINKNDILITSRGTQLKTAIVSDTLNNAVISGNILTVKPNQDIIPMYLYAYLKSRHGQKELLSKKSGATKAHLVLNVSSVGEIKVPVPSVEIQKKISNIFVINEELYRLNIETAEKQKEIADRVLMELFNKLY